MKNTLKYLMTLGLVGSMFFVTGCPEDNNEDGCTTTEDCDDGQTCNVSTNTCEDAGASCADDTECTEEGEYCLGEGASKVCRQPVSCGELGDATVVASYCGNLLTDFDAETEIAFCDSSTDPDVPTCQAKTRLEYRVVAVTDVSGLQDDGTVDNTDCEASTAGNGSIMDAGTDLIDVDLLNADNEVIGFGKAIELSVGSGMPEFTDWATVFAGEPRAEGYLTGICPSKEDVGGTERKFRENSVVSLGCGGSLFLEFRDAAGELILVDPATHQIAVTEFGPYCNADDGADDPNAYGSDKFDIALCATPVGATAADIGVEDCVYKLNETPEQGFTVLEFSDNTDIEIDASNTSFEVEEED